MTIKEAIKDLKEELKDKDIEYLKDRIETLEKVIINLVNRVDYLESRCQ